MGGGSTPCASCKLLRRRCAKDCIFAPYFPPDDPHKFAIVHKVFGASNVSKMLQELPVQQRGDAVSSLVYEANARMRDPVYGCVGAISYLQNQVSQLQMQLAVAQAEILCIQMQQQDHHQHQSSSSSAATAYNNNNNNLSSLIPSSIINHDDVDDAKALFFSSSTGSNNSFNSNNIQNYLNFASSTSSAVIMQDPLKRESLWT